MRNKNLLLSFVLAAAMTGCVNDADVTSDGGGISKPDARGNMEISFVVPNSSNGSRSVEDSGIYDSTIPEEYKVTSVTLYLFDSSSKNLVNTFSVSQSELGTSGKTGGGTKEGETIKYSGTKVLTVDPGTYDILAIANGAMTFNGGQESALLAQIDGGTYGNGLINQVPANGFIMSNRASANQNVIARSPEEAGADTRTSVSINLERTVAKLMVRNKTQESYTLANPSGVTYATVRLNNYKFVNLLNKFYTFRHVATLDNAAETPSAPASYSIAAGNFGNIVDGNGYLIDPCFFDKTVAGASSFTGGSFYTNHLSQQADSDWAGLATATEYTSAYCLENCMFRPAQNTTYTTGIMLKGTFTPAASQTIGNDGNAVTNADVFNRLYYFNYKFYTSLESVGRYGNANISGLSESSTTEELEAKQIMRFDKNAGVFSTFYNYWIKHQTNNDEAVMGVMEFGIVRNNIYSVNITNIKNLGPGEPDKKPEPDEYKAYLDVTFGVDPWIVRDQDASLDK